MTPREKTITIIDQAVKTLLENGFQVARPAYAEDGKMDGLPLTWLYIADKEGRNVIGAEYDTFYREWTFTKPYYPSKDNGTGARLDYNGSGTLPLERIKWWIDNITDEDTIAMYSGFEFNRKTLKCYKDFAEFKREHLDKNTHLVYNILTPDNQ